MKKEILCTLGPASMSSRMIARLEDMGVHLFRINLSHTQVEKVDETIRFIQARTSVPICIDSEGAQIRTATFVQGKIDLPDHAVVRLVQELVAGDEEQFNLHPIDIIREFEVGDFLSIDFNAVLGQVIAREGDDVLVRIVNGGTVGSNKAITLDREIDMPPLTPKDEAAMRIGLRLGIRHFALSFANRGSDVDQLRTLVGPEAVIISKIECRGGLKNLRDIARKSDAILIDRGDLSRQIPIERIPDFQKKIIRQVKALGKKIYVATNFLESMLEAPIPTRAEVNDIYNTFVDGADGLVLAAETAIGRFPLESAQILVRVIGEFERISQGDDFGDVDHIDPISLLIEPHGGKLVHREAVAPEAEEMARLLHLMPGHAALLDCEQIALGTYSPLTGFMDERTLESVLADCRLPDGGPAWTLPIVLTVDKAALGQVGAGDRIVLADGDGVAHALLDVSQVYSPDLPRLCSALFGARSSDHPGGRRILEGRPQFVAGEITLLRRVRSPFRHFSLSPAQARLLFTHKGWSRVVGFHACDPAYQLHRYIQQQALERSFGDGLFINSATCPGREGEFLPEPIIKSYLLMLTSGAYPKGQVVLGGISTISRDRTPRETVFSAICMKNMGCSHFVIDDTLAAEGKGYSLRACQDLFESLGNIGITPIFFDRIGFDPALGEYCGRDQIGAIDPFTSDQVRESLRSGCRLPNWFVDDRVQEMLLSRIAAGEPVFYEARR